MCLLAAIAVVLLAGCGKEATLPLPDTLTQVADSTVRKTNTFTTYTIPAGQHYCNNNSYPSFLAPALYFTVLFDSAAVYQTKNLANQSDYNKLYGFSDNNSHHQQYSARFGWRWKNGQLELAAYTYNKGVRSEKWLGAVPLGTSLKCAIVVQGDHYDFVLNGVTTAVPRESQTTQASGYKLLPYFGGDETAPHTIAIKIREDSGL